LNNFTTSKFDTPHAKKPDIYHNFQKSTKTIAV